MDRPLRKTIARALAENLSGQVNCADPRSFHNVRLDLRALVGQLGREHGTMHDDLVKPFLCRRCANAVRPRRPVVLSRTPDYLGIQRRKRAG